MHLTGHQFLTALAIGAAVFAFAALWPLSEWAAGARRSAGLAAALAVIAACLALDAHAIALPAMEPDGLRARIAHALAWTVPPLFIALPAAVCVASAQSLARVGVRPRVARGVALAMALLTTVAAPVGAIVGGCGLAGVCS